MIEDKKKARTFWNRRYERAGISGKGSRGKERLWRWNLIDKYISDLSEVIDVGCGDLAFWKGRSCPDYLGIDISNTIIERNKQLKPDWKFINASSDLRIEGLKKDNVFCLGLLFHLLNEGEYIKTIENLCYYSKKNIVIYTWVKNPLFPYIEDHYQKYRVFKNYQYIFKNNGFYLTSFTLYPDRIGGFYFYKISETEK
jgi:hypothetical protein